MAQNVNPTPSASSGFDKDAAERGSATSSAQVSAIYFISFGLSCSLSSDFPTFFQYFAKFHFTLRNFAFEMIENSMKLKNVAHLLSFDEKKKNISTGFFWLRNFSTFEKIP